MFLPSCGEPLAVLNNTFQYVSKMNWRGLKTVYVLDDSGREQVLDLADQYNFRYIVRPNPGEMKKAGNLIHALGVSDGDFIAAMTSSRCARSFSTRSCPTSPSPGRHLVDSPVLRCEQLIILLHPALCRDAPGDLSDLSGPAPLQGSGSARAFTAAQPSWPQAGSLVPIGEDVHSGVKLWWAGYETRYLPLCW